MFKPKESVFKFTSMAIKHKSNIPVKTGRKCLQICIYPCLSLTRERKDVNIMLYTPHCYSNYLSELNRQDVM